jgi:hypothetical protein
VGENITAQSGSTGGKRPAIHMIISHKHKFIFLKTTKTGGTSIEIALSQHCGPKDVLTPISPEDEVIRRELGFRGPQNYFVPLAKYRLNDWVRLFVRQRRRKLHNHDPACVVQSYAGKNVWKDYFVFCFERDPYDKAISRYYWSTRHGDRPSINAYLESVPPTALSNWHIYTIADKVAVNFVGRYERLNADLQYVWEKLQLPSPPNLPRAKQNHRVDRRHYSEVLDAQARKRIAEVCSREIAEFDYPFKTSSRAQAQASS